MKKSKILIPAFAVLALSVGASVTGTVAWFTADRTAQFGTSFSVADIDGNLTVALEANDRAGTKLENSNIAVNGKLTHGSYNAKANASEGKLYVANISNDPDTNTAHVDSYTDLGSIPEKSGNVESQTSSAWQAGVDTKDGNKKVWYGVSFKATFTLGESGYKGKNFLFVDFKKCTASETTAEDANKGFTVALTDVSKDRTNPIVIGADENKTHVNGTAAGSTKEYTADEYHTFGEDVAKAQDEQSAAALKLLPGYIGEFPTTEGDEKNKITVTFVAWFEGENSNVVSGKGTDLKAIAANFAFYARRSNVA